MNKSTIALMMAMLSGTAYADSTQLTPNFSPESVTVSTSAGMLSGKPMWGRRDYWLLKGLSVPVHLV